MPQFSIREAVFPDDAELVRRMFRDYQTDIAVDLCFQAFEEELAGLPGKYECILLTTGGCVALRPIAPGAIELKRLFVYPAARGRGLGRLLVETAIQIALQRGYQRMQLDTIASKMPSAMALYQALGFKQIPAGRTLEGPELVYMELDLAAIAAHQNTGE